MRKLQVVFLHGTEDYDPSVNATLIEVCQSVVPDTNIEILHATSISSAQKFLEKTQTSTYLTEGAALAFFYADTNDFSLQSIRDLESRFEITAFLPPKFKAKTANKVHAALDLKKGTLANVQTLMSRIARDQKQSDIPITTPDNYVPRPETPPQNAGLKSYGSSAKVENVGVNLKDEPDSPPPE